MARSDLLLRIGADATQLKQALNKLNKDLIKTGRKLESIGKSLSFRLSVPIAAAGAASVNAFAQFEKFEKGLQAVSGSAKETEATLSRLRKLALQPGIDLQNAVTASIRLQAVGFEAQKAEELILQFSKAVTLAGGTGEDLGEVVRQITQIISKGKVLSSDFRVIQERVPAIGIALKTAFGSTNIEQIRETGISASDFVDRLTEGIKASKEFQNVQGGLSNSLNNFQQAIQGSLVTLGKTISESINLEQVLADVADVIGRATEAFANLTPRTQKIIITLAAVAAGIGPVLVGIGALVSALPLLQAGLAAVFSSITPIVAVIGLATAAFLKFNGEIDYAAEANKRVNDTLSKAAGFAEKETSAVNDLVKSIQSETTSKGEKAKAIEQLKRISPDYFGGLDIERVKTDDLIKSSNEYNNSLQKRQALQGINQRSLEVQERLAEVNERINKSTSVGNAIIGALSGNLTGYASGVGQLGKESKLLKAELSALAKEAERVSNAKIISDVATPSFAPIVPEKVDSGTGAKKASESIEELSKIASQIPIEPVQLLESSLISISNIEGAGVLFEDGFQPFADAVEPVKSLNELLAEQQVRLQQLSNVANAYSAAFRDASNGQVKGFKDVANAALSAAKEVVKAKLLEATASFFADSFAKLGIFGAVLATGAGAVIGGLFSATIGKLGVPALEEGGVVTGPTLALIGEGKENEVVLPLSKLNNLLSNNQPQERLLATVGIDQLYIALERYKLENGRVN